MRHATRTDEQDDFGLRIARAFMFPGVVLLVQVHKCTVAAIAAPVYRNALRHRTPGSSYVNSGAS